MWFDGWEVTKCFDTIPQDLGKILSPVFGKLACDDRKSEKGKKISRNVEFAVRL